MALIAFAFPLAVLALVAVAIYEHVNSVKLSLPLSSALTFLTILLPLLAAGTTFLLAHQTRKPSSSSPSSSSSLSSSSLALLLTRPRTLQLLHVLQAIATTILATLYFQDLVPSAVRECTLSTRWQHLFRAKDALAIRTIQDALDCCGFRSVRDMAWPFPPAAVPCAARFQERGALACRDPWTGALQRSAGVNFGVVLAVGLLQILSIALARRHPGDRSSEGGFSWGDIFRRFTRQDSRGRYASSRPLLTSGHAQTEEVDEEVGQVGQHGRGQQAYGATENDHSPQGPRLEPSGLQAEQNEWRES